MSELGRSSKRSNSTARSTAETGVPKVAAIPAAAPADKSVLRSAELVRKTWPTNEPSAPPVAMMGPSAPNGPPVPMATAAETGLKNVSFIGTRLSEVRTRSIASGMPWPRMPSAPKRAITPTTIPPNAGTTMTHRPRWLPSGVAGASESVPWNESAVTTLMSRIRSCAANPETMPMSTERTTMTTIRRSMGRRSCGKCDASRAGRIEGATGTSSMGTL
jgi:hypothetical protein